MEAVGSGVMRTERFTHTEFTNHCPGNARSPFDIILRTGGDITKNHLFGGASAHQADQHTHQTFAALRVAIFFRQLHRGAKCTSARNNRYFVQRLSLFGFRQHNGMPGFVVSGQLFLFSIQHVTAPFASPGYFVASFFEVGQLNRFRTAPCGKQRRFINEIHQVRTGKPGRSACYFREIYTFGQRNALDVNIKNLLTSFKIRQINENLTVKTARTHQRRIEHIRAIGGRDNDDALRGIKAVHFDQQCIERLFALVMSAAHTGKPAATDGIDFVHKNNARRALPPLLKHITDTTGADADKHFDKVRPADGEKRHFCLTSDRLGNQRFTGSRRTRQQNALRHFSAKPLKLFRIFQKFDYFLQFFLRLINPGDIGKRRAVLIVALKQFSAALTETHRPSASHLHLPEEKEIDDDKTDDERRDTPERLPER